MLKEFAHDECGGVPTIDWLVILGGLTASGLMIVEVTTDTLGGHSQVVRGELQDNHFETAWIDNVPVGPSGQGMPGLENVVPTSGDDSDTGGNPNGNNGHGNDSDGNDDSNPGASNSSDDDTDDDGTPGNSGGGGVSGSGSSGNGNGNPNGNNGHGNDSDGNDDSNPGASNSSDDHTDDDGTPGNSTVHGDGDDDGLYFVTGGTGNSAGSGQGGPVIPASNVAGCPSDDYMADPVSITGEQLEDDEIEVENMTVGGASTHLYNCSGISGRGYFHANPTYTLNLSGMDGFDRFEVDLKSSCDTTLLIQDAAGNLHFDDDSGRRFNSRLRLYNMDDLDGQVNIWIGTYWGDTCDDVEMSIELDD
jgi:hypothetical protein